VYRSGHSVVRPRNTRRRRLNDSIFGAHVRDLGRELDGPLASALEDSG